LVTPGDAAKAASFAHQFYSVVALVATKSY
jgi:hypothetical protein